MMRKFATHAPIGNTSILQYKAHSDEYYGLAFELVEVETPIEP